MRCSIVTTLIFENQNEVVKTIDGQNARTKVLSNK